MMNRSRVLLVGFLVAIVVTYGSVVVSGFGYKGARDAAVFEQQLRDTLPVGTSREEVDERFRAIGVGRKYLAADHVIVAISPTVRRGLFAFENIEIRAQFDAADRLQNLEFRPGLPG